MLIPVPQREWREPSLARPKDQFGNQNRTRFRLTARLNDGHVRWRGWFDSRDDADAFLDALALSIVEGMPVPVELWRLPSPWWHPDIGPDVSYDFASLTFLTADAGSAQTFTSPTDWNSANNSIEFLGGGGQGGYAESNPGIGSATGGGGSEYRKLVNFSFAVPGTTTAQYEIGRGGKSALIDTGYITGGDGGSTWWDGASAAAATGASFGGGGGGASGGTGSRAGGTAGSGGHGGSGFNGGRGGNISGNTSSLVATGGGGAAGSTGVGGNGADRSNNADFGSAGGTGDAGNGGGGHAGGVGPITGGAGGNGYEWQHGSTVDGPDYGSGGGGSGTSRPGSSGSGGSAGTYGAGSGGSVSKYPVSNDSGAQGIIVVTYAPRISSGAGMLLFF